jgi:signal transduction histidine kinase
MRKTLKIRLLIIASYILLTCFIGYWLVSRYSQEKSSLRNELQKDFFASEQKMLDSLIIKVLVNPVLKDEKLSNTLDSSIKTSAKTTIIRKRDASPGSTNKVHVDTNLMRVEVETKEWNGRNVSVDSNTSTKKQFRIVSNDTLVGRERLIISSVKLFENQLNEQKGGSNKNLFYQFSSQLDTTILINDFNSKLRTKNLEPQWFSSRIEEIDSTTLTNANLLFYSNMLNMSIGVNVYKYKFYILNKLFPNIAFALVLLALTASAFAIAYVSLKKQIILNEIRNEFVGNITHELRTPVSTVKVALEAIQKFNVKNNPNKVDEYLNLAQLELNRLDMLVHKVLNSSIYDQKKEPINLRPISVDEVIFASIKAMQANFERYNAEVLYKGNDNPFVLADDIHLQGVIINILDNSLKYNKSNPKIEIIVESSNFETIISIKDNGIGIPDEYKNKVFEKFFRVPTQNQHNIKGYGLGLNYVQTVVKQLKGNISVTSNIDKGCTFTITLPTINK